MKKLNKANPDIKAAHQKIVEYLDTKDNYASMYATILATSKTLSEFILKSHNLIDLPREIQYFIAQSWNQYASIFLPDHLIGKFNEDFQDYFESGDLDDRFAMVVKQLYEICKKEKLL